MKIPPRTMFWGQTVATIMSCFVQVAVLNFAFNNIPEVCDKHQLSPTLFYQWQKTFFENGAAAFQRSPRTETSQRHHQLVDALQAKIKTKDEVIAEIMAEHILLKKELGEI